MTSKNSMKTLRQFYYCLLIFLSMYSKVFGQTIDSTSDKEPFHEYSIRLRPNGSIGFLDNNLASSFGLRVLLNAGGNKAYGLEISRFQNYKNNMHFYTAGIVLEQKLFDWFNMSIGTIGYFNVKDNSENAVGLVSNLGYAPNSKKRLSPFITYRTDIIFTSKIQFVHTLNIGLNITL